MFGGRESAMGKAMGRWQRRILYVLWGLGGGIFLAWKAAAATGLQFDVFLGYGSSGGNDGIIHLNHWFPVACEVFNPGPTLNAVVEISTMPGGRGHVFRFPVELPTATRKRLFIPLYAGMIGGMWYARLLTADGKVLGEKGPIAPRSLDSRAILLGALSQRIGGVPSLTGSAQGSKTVSRANLLPSLFPKSALALEGLSALYLTTGRALELERPQWMALQQWVAEGGWLIVAIDQVQDLDGLPWLKTHLPALPGTLVSTHASGCLQEWVRTEPISPSKQKNSSRTLPIKKSRSPSSVYSKLEPDSQFAKAELPIYRVGSPVHGKVVLACSEGPLIVEGRWGRGKLTLLLFHPEREPIASWKLKGWFWRRLLQVPSTRLQPANSYSGITVEQILRLYALPGHIRKISLSSLILLLVVYLLVIGPFDRILLKKLHKEILTWITFPCYVILFTGLIYWIGYRLRAGQTEAKQFHVVDIISDHGRTYLRGRSLIGIYSAVNRQYPIEFSVRDAGVYPLESQRWSGVTAFSGITADWLPGKLTWKLPVPVWTRRFCVVEWDMVTNRPLLQIRWLPGKVPTIEIQNRSGFPLKEVAVLWRKNYYVQQIQPSAKGLIRFSLNPNKGTEWKNLSHTVQLLLNRASVASALFMRSMNEDQQSSLPLSALDLLALSIACGGGENQSELLSSSPSSLKSSLLFSLWREVQEGAAILIAVAERVNPNQTSWIHLEKGVPIRQELYAWRVVLWPQETNTASDD